MNQGDMGDQEGLTKTVSGDSAGSLHNSTRIEHCKPIICILYILIDLIGYKSSISSTLTYQVWNQRYVVRGHMQGLSSQTQKV